MSDPVAAAKNVEIVKALFAANADNTYRCALIARSEFYNGSNEVDNLRAVYGDDLIQSLVTGGRIYSSIAYSDIQAQEFVVDKQLTDAGYTLHLSTHPADPHGKHPRGKHGGQ
jgi:hypothetical protein